MNEQGTKPPEATEAKNKGMGRDVVVTPWPGGWAVLRVGGDRAGRVRTTKDEALRVARYITRSSKARLFVTDAPIDFAGLELLVNERKLDTEEGLGTPVLDARKPVGRVEARRAAELSTIREPRRR